MNSLQLLIENDNDILKEYVSGNREIAATSFVRKYQKFVFSVAFRYLNNYEDAEDISQEVFVKALEKISNFRADSSLKTWLYRITANSCINNIRKQKLFSFLKFGAETKDLVKIESKELLPDEVMTSKELEKLFLSVVTKLPKKQRETFGLRYFDGLKYEEISEILGTSIGGLKANYYQAVKKIAYELKKSNLIDGI